MTAVETRPWRRNRNHAMPPGLAERVAPPALVREWSDVKRRGRTCWYCGTVFLRATDADECELAAEGVTAS